MTDEVIIPEKGDICRHIRSGTEYVLYEMKTKKFPDGDVHYVTWLMTDQATGKLGDPFVVLGGFNKMEFVERGAPREPGEKPVRPLDYNVTARSREITARPGRLRDNRTDG